jgi:hypothetical protein
MPLNIVTEIQVAADHTDLEYHDKSQGSSLSETLITLYMSWWVVSFVSRGCGKTKLTLICHAWSPYMACISHTLRFRQLLLQHPVEKTSMCYQAHAWLLDAVLRAQAANLNIKVCMYVFVLILQCTYSCIHPVKVVLRFTVVLWDLQSVVVAIGYHFATLPTIALQGWNPTHDNEVWTLLK